MVIGINYMFWNQIDQSEVKKNWNKGGENE